MSIAEKKSWGRLLDEATKALHTAGVADARRAALWMLGEIVGCSRTHLMAYPDRFATLEQAEQLAVMVARRLQHEPVQYILGYTEFFGLRVRVTPGVLIPRPETEQVVETALERLRGCMNPRVLDVGTGSGCIALALKHARPDASVEACDVSEAALDVARTNAEALHLDVTFHRADVLADNFSTVVAGPYDCVVSNPPYIADEEADTLDRDVRAYEPHLALFAGTDPLRFYRVIAGHAPALLAPGGLLVFETHAFYADAVCNMLQEMDFIEIQSQNDLAGLPRIVTARRRGG